MSRCIARTCFYLQKATFRTRIRSTNDKVAALLQQKSEALESNFKEKLLRNARGTKDFHPEQMKIRDEVFQTIVNCFRQHGATTIDTPVIENLNLLKEKYGEDSKLIYELKNSPNDDEDLALRYDLTVPFARYLVQNRLTTMKRFHIGKVFRLDDPKMTRGRFREFYQCDFDIAGDFDPMISDAECLKVLVEVLDRLSIGNYRILINHRKLLDAIFTVCQVQPSMFRSLSSSIDKLDKNSWSIVRNEMINEKGLTDEQADRIWSFVQRSGGVELIDELRQDKNLISERLAVEALADLDLLFHYLRKFQILDKIVFDLKLARGLDYYTGVVFEAILNEKTLGIGSIAAGGRYDELIEKLHPKRRRIPCVGLSVGVERIFSIKEIQRDRTKKIKTIETEIFVASAEKNFLDHRLELCDELWRNGFKVEMSLKVNPKLLDQIQFCEKNQIDLCLIVGSDEIENRTLKIRHVKTREEFSIRRDELFEQIQKHLEKLRRE